MLTLLDFEKLLKEARAYKLNAPDAGGDRNVKAWHYFEIDVYGTPSLINIREGTDGKVIIYSISQKGRVSKPSRWRPRLTAGRGAEDLLTQYKYNASF